MAATLHVPPVVPRKSSTPPALVISRLFDDSPSSRCEVVSLWFICISLMIPRWWGGARLEAQWVGGPAGLLLLSPAAVPQ